MILRRVGLAVSDETAPACIYACEAPRMLSRLHEEGYHVRYTCSFFYYFHSVIRHAVPASLPSHSVWSSTDHDDDGSPRWWP